MAIGTKTVAHVYTLSGTLENTLKALLRYRSDSRNPAQEAEVDALMAALKAQVDATVAP